jgi:hypothetical protein
VTCGAGRYRPRMQVYRATDPSGQEWRIELDDPPDVKARIFVAFGKTVTGSGEKLDGIGALGRWLVEHGMTEADLRPW